MSVLYVTNGKNVISYISTENSSFTSLLNKCRRSKLFSIYNNKNHKCDIIANVRVETRGNRKYCRFSFVFKNTAWLAVCGKSFLGWVNCG